MDAVQQQQIKDWVCLQRRSPDLMLLDPVRQEVFHVPWPELTNGPDGVCARISPSDILNFLRSRKLLWTCFCSSSDPLGHPIAEFVHYDHDEVRVYCSNRINPCGFYLNLNQIHMRSEISFEFDAFEQDQSYDGHINAMLEWFRIDRENGIIEGWFGSFDDNRCQKGQRCISC